MNEEIKMRDSRIDYFKREFSKHLELLKEKEQEIKRLQSLMSNIEDMKETVVEKMDNMKEHFNDRFENSTFTSAHNNYIINHLENNNNNLNFNIKFSEARKEKLDHISKEEMLHILNEEDFDTSVVEYVGSVYFNPKAPSNCKWCITDLTSKSGALEYNHESNTITRKETKEVITRNLQNALFSMSETLEELRETKSFTDQQGINYNRFYNIMCRSEFHPSCINKLKELAYRSRTYIQALWGHLDIEHEKEIERPRITN